jgi:hypothetical protein
LTRRNLRRWGTGTIPRPFCIPAFPARISLRFLTAVLCFAALLVSANKLYAGPAPARQRPDQPYALIFGTVWSPDDHPLYGVKVKIRRADQKKARWELLSDHNGEFAQRVPVGPSDYLVSADLKGYKSPSGKQLHLDEEVKVHIDNDEREDIGLHLKQ